MTKNNLTGLFIVVTLLVAANVKADFEFEFKSINNDPAQSLGKGLLESLNLTASDKGSGVEFTFSSNFDNGDGSAGKIWKNEIYIYNTLYGTDDSVFKTSDGVEEGGGISGGEIDGQKQPLRNADYTATSDLIPTADGYETSFFLAYADGMSWDDYQNLLIGEDPFKIAMHLQSLVQGESAKVYGEWTAKQTNATPEPATLAVLGLGLAGLGLARRRSGKR